MEKASHPPLFCRHPCRKSRVGRSGPSVLSKALCTTPLPAWLRFTTASVSNSARFFWSTLSSNAHVCSQTWSHQHRLWKLPKGNSEQNREMIFFFALFLQQLFFFSWLSQALCLSMWILELVCRFPQKKKPLGILFEVVLNSEVNLKITDILLVLSFPLPEYETATYLGL